MKFIVTILGVLALLFVIAVVGAYPTMWLFNYLFAPSLLLAVFGVPALGFWKALAVNMFFGFFVKTSNTTSKS